MQHSVFTVVPLSLACHVARSCHIARSFGHITCCSALQHRGAKHLILESNGYGQQEFVIAGLASLAMPGFFCKVGSKGVQVHGLNW